MLSDGPNRIKRHARLARRADNILRRVRALEADFEAADSTEAELRINEQIARQHEYLRRTEARVKRSLTNA